MKKIHLLSVVSGIALLILAGGAQAAGDADKGRLKAAMCQGCHGIVGYRTAYPQVYSVPKLGGQHADYLVAALEAYQSGARKHPSMGAIAASLSAQDKADLAAYYSSGSATTTASGK